MATQPGSGSRGRSRARSISSRATGVGRCSPGALPRARLQDDRVRQERREAQPWGWRLGDRHAALARPAKFSALLRPSVHGLCTLPVDHTGSPLNQPTGYRNGPARVSFGEWRRVVLCRRLEPEQLWELASCVPAVLAGTDEEAQGLSVLSSGTLADQSACDRVARAYTGSHGAAGGDVPTLCGEALGRRFQPCSRLGQIGPSVGRGDMVPAAPTRAHGRRPTASSRLDPARMIASRRTVSQNARPTLALGPAFRRRSSRSYSRTWTRLPVRDRACSAKTDRDSDHLSGSAVGDLTASTSRSLSAPASPRAKDPYSKTVSGAGSSSAAIERRCAMTSEPRCARRSTNCPAAFCRLRDTRTVRPTSRRSTIPSRDRSATMPLARVRPTPEILARVETGSSASTRAREASRRPAAPGMTASTGLRKSTRSL